MRAFKTVRSMFLAMLLAGASTTVASAVELKNEDAADYAIKVKSVSMETTLNVSAHQWTAVICVGGCTFSARGMGRVRAKRDDLVFVRDGKLVREAAPKASR